MGLELESIFREWKYFALAIDGPSTAIPAS
jgi:hypothetical protein